MALSPDTRTLLVAVFRSEEVPGEHPLRRLQPEAHLVLSPFSPAEVADLVRPFLEE